MERPLYINWLVNEEGVTFEDGVALKCYKLSYETDEAVFDDWALHIRKHYVEDDELTDDSVATGLSIEDYLRKNGMRRGLRGTLLFIAVLVFRTFVIFMGVISALIGPHGVISTWINSHFNNDDNDD